MDYFFLISKEICLLYQLKYIFWNTATWLNLSTDFHLKDMIQKVSYENVLP